MRVSILIVRSVLVFVLTASAAAIDSKVCGGCHPGIYRRYLTTPMARTSGFVNESTAPLSKRAEFEDAATATRFTLERKGKATFVHFTQGEGAGERRLDYFIGAGLLGRSYASSIDGFLFQAPLSYYTSADQWDLSPGFDSSDRLTLTRPVEPACLNCHASELRTLAGTVNGYEDPAFTEAGVSCERCHGPGDAHVARMQSGKARLGTAIVNPAKLNSAERDSVCEQCHLVGVVRIAKTGAPKYEPGRRIFDSTSAFVWNADAGTLRSNSHFEQLVRSACWKDSQGKLWCGSCHSIHTEVPASERTTFYRERCLQCHASGARECTARYEIRRIAGDNCVACHMPRQVIATVAHTVQVDHTISRRTPIRAGMDVPETASMIAFPGSSPDDRELGLAYASEALPSNNRVWGEKALSLLVKAVPAHPEDGPVAVQLAQLYDRVGREEQACILYEQAMKVGVAGTSALVNMGTCEARLGNLEAAMKLWSEALRRNPALESARGNLAMAQSQTSNAAGARETLQIGLRFDPLSKRFRKFLEVLTAK